MTTELNDGDKENLRNSIETIDKIIAVGNQALQKYPTDHYDLEHFMFINMLDRFRTHLTGINLLLRHYDKNPDLEAPIGLIARAGLLDFMIITYISSYHVDIGKVADPSGEIYKQELNKLLCDQVHYTFKFVREAKNSGLISEDDYRKVIESSVYNYSFLFKEEESINFHKPENKLLTQKTLSPNQLFKRIHSHSLTTKFSMIYDLYTYYSKYEHYGIMTHFMQRQGVDVDLERIFGALQYLIKGMGATFRYLSGSTNMLDVEIKLLDKLEEQFIEQINSKMHD